MIRGPELDVRFVWDRFGSIYPSPVGAVLPDFERRRRPSKPLKFASNRDDFAQGNPHRESCNDFVMVAAPWLQACHAGERTVFRGKVNFLAWAQSGGMSRSPGNAEPRLVSVNPGGSTE